MKHMANILLLGIVLLGIAMAADTPWGFGVALAPFAIWGAQFLLLIHKSIWAAAVFWGGIAYFQWQIALVVALAYVAVWFVREARVVYKQTVPRGHRKKPLDAFQDSFTYDQRYHIGARDE